MGTGNEERGTRNGERGTKNEESGTGDGERETDEREIFKTLSNSEVCNLHWMDSEISESLPKLLLTSAVSALICIISCLIWWLRSKEEQNVLVLRNAVHVVYALASAWFPKCLAISRSPFARFLM